MAKHRPLISAFVEEALDASTSPSQQGITGPFKYLAIFFRAIGAQLVSSLTFTRSRFEPLKVAIHKDRRVTLIRLLVHVLPLAGALCLIVLNGTVLRIKRTSWLPLLQFVAKLHEILMQTSLAATLMAYTRAQLCKGAAPFGAIFSGIQVSSLSYIWSLEFAGLVTAKWLPPLRRLEFAVLVAVCLALAAAVGPSSAILMLPRLDSFSLGTIKLVVPDAASLLPAVLDTTTTASA